MLKKYQSYIYTIFLKNFFIISLIFFCLIIVINFFEEVRFSEKTNIDIYYSIYLSLLTTTKEPIFASSEGKTIRILIDSDDSKDTGYSLPGVGADQMIEMYGKGQTVLSSVLYSFNDNRDSNDWNGFFALNSVNSRTKGVNTETQVPLFDLGASVSDEMKIVWQSTDNIGMIDLADNVVSLPLSSLRLSHSKSVQQVLREIIK